MSEWLDGVKAAEGYYQRYSRLRKLTACGELSDAIEYVEGWNSYIEHKQLADKLNAIETEYCRQVVNINYAAHTELEVLCILQKLQDKRRQQIAEATQFDAAKIIE